MVRINDEFQQLIRPLNGEEYAALEKSILEEGCRDSLVIWNEFIIDGHHRYQICQKHNIKFHNFSMEFETKEEVKLWIIKNQLGRRNLKPKEYAELRGLKYGLEKTPPGGNRRAKLQNAIMSKTSQDIADEEGIDKTTLWRDEKFAQSTQILRENVGNKAREKALTDKTPKSQIIAITKNYTSEEQKEIFELSEKKDYDLGKAKREYQQKKIAEERKADPIPKGQYTIIYADPPWQYDFSVSKSRDIENQYPTMELEQIKQLKLPISNNAVLLLWNTAPKLKEGFEVLESWGFKYKTQAIWDKEMMGMGYWFRGQHETLLIGVRGDFSPPKPKNRFPSVIRQKRTKHSKKPDIVYNMIEKMFPNQKYLEVFAREKYNDNWEVWGNEL